MGNRIRLSAEQTDRRSRGFGRGEDAGSSGKAPDGVDLDLEKQVIPTDVVVEDENRGRIETEFLTVLVQA